MSHVKAFVKRPFYESFNIISMRNIKSCQKYQLILFSFYKKISNFFKQLIF